MGTALGDSTVCRPGHRQGSKPYAVPVPGNRERTAPVYVVYHGRDYLDRDGRVVRHPVWHVGMAAAEHTMTRHEMGLEHADDESTLDALDREYSRNTQY